jgi:hypothetical protein
MKPQAPKSLRCYGPMGGAPEHVKVSLTGAVVEPVSCSSSFLCDTSWMRGAGATKVRCAVSSYQCSV